MTVETLAAQARRLRNEAQAKLSEARKLTQQAQIECTHPREQVHEVDFKPETSVAYNRAPWRVCKLCGLAEWGWNCGNQVLAPGCHKIKRISEDEAEGYRQGPIHQNANFILTHADAKQGITQEWIIAREIRRQV